MKYVKCTYISIDLLSIYKDRLTIGKIYEVVQEKQLNNTFIFIYIIDDAGAKGLYRCNDHDDTILFEDATKDVRDNKINVLLR